MLLSMYTHPSPLSPSPPPLPFPLPPSPPPPPPPPPLLFPQASPGNLQQLEDVVFGSGEMATSTSVIAVKLTNEAGQRMVGVAYADACMQRLGVAEFLDSDQFSNLEVGLHRGQR